MAHIIRWDNEAKTVIFQQYTEDASKDDLYHLAQKSHDMMATVSHTVHIIIDERNIDLVLNSADMKYLDRLTPENQGAVVMVIPPTKKGYKKLVQVIGKNVAPSAFDQPYFAGTIEDARRFLREAFGVQYDSESGC